MPSDDDRATSTSGPASGFDANFDALFRRAYGVAYRLLGSRSEAEDIAQEALARAFLRWSSIEVYAEAWVVRVASNLAIGSWRKLRRLQPLTMEGATEGLSSDRVDLHRALKGLPRRQREVVVLRYLGDLSEAEIAATLGCSTGSVKTHASRGLEALRKALGDV